MWSFTVTFIKTELSSNKLMKLNQEVRGKVGVCVAENRWLGLNGSYFMVNVFLLNKTSCLNVGSFL